MVSSGLVPGFIQLLHKEDCPELQVRITCCGFDRHHVLKFLCWPFEIALAQCWKLELLCVQMRSILTNRLDGYCFASLSMWIELLVDHSIIWYISHWLLLLGVNPLWDIFNIFFGFLVAAVWGRAASHHYCFRHSRGNYCRAHLCGASQFTKRGCPWTGTETIKPLKFVMLIRFILLVS